MRVSVVVDDDWVAGGIALLASVVFGILIYPGVPPALSITGRAFLLVTLLALLLVLVMESGGGSTMGLLVASVAFITGLYVPVAFGYAMAYGLPLVAILAFVSLGIIYYAQEGLLIVSRRRVFAIGAVLLIATAGFVAVDVAYGEVTYELSVHDEVAVEEADESIDIGTATARNSFVFREPVTFSEMDLDVCLYVDGERQQPIYQYGGTGASPSSVPGSGTVETALTARFSEETVTALPETVPIERAETCPDERSGTVLVVATGAE